MMVQATIVEIEKIVLEEEEVRGTRGLHMVEEEDIVQERMMNVKMRLMTTASNSVLVVDVIEEATMKKDLAN
jgi:RecA/RadA recombinase